MKWTLGDNAVDGIRFVLVGAGSLLVLRLTYAGIHRALAGSGGDALATACAAFQHGYWTTDHTWWWPALREALALAWHWPWW